MSVVLIAASTAAAVIHFALGPEHLAELGWLGVGFYLAGALQLGWAGLALVVARGRGASTTYLQRVILPAGIGINVAILAAWLLSRTVGLPAGEQPWTPEAIGIPDAITALLEGGLILGMARAWHQRRAVGPAPTSSSGTGYPSLVGAAPILALILVAAVTAIGTPHAYADGGADGGAHNAGEAHDVGGTHDRGGAPEPDGVHEPDEVHDDGAESVEQKQHSH